MRRLPDNKLLKGLFGWFIGAAAFRFLTAAFRRDRTVHDAVGNFFADLVAPYFWGSFSSQIPLVWLGSLVCGVVYALSVTAPSAGAGRWARRSLFVTMVLSLFTVWLEPYTSVSGATTNAALGLAKVPMRIFDVAASVVWVVVYLRASAAIRRDLTAASDPGASGPNGWAGSLRAAALIGGGLLVLVAVYQWMRA